MKIAVVAGTFPALSETFVLNHITGLMDAGHEVRIFASSPPEGQTHVDFFRYHLEDRTYSPYIPRILNRYVHLLGTLRHLHRKEAFCCLNPFRHGIGVLSLKAPYVCRGLADGRFNVVHCHFGQNGLALACLRDIFKAPLVTSFHGGDLVMFGRLAPRVYRGLFREGDAFVANSGYTKECLLKMGCPGRKIICIPACLNDTAVTPREKLFDSNTVRILTVARLIEAKGVQYCLHAVKLLRDEGYHLRYTVVGDGPYRQELELLAAKLEMLEVVAFAGAMQKEDVYRQYTSSDIFVLPSVRGKRGWVEAQGLVIHEAQLHGVPVVASRIGGIPESVNNGEAGLLCEPADPADLAKKIRRLIDDRAFAENIAKAGTEYCRAKYSKNVCISRLVQLYKSL